jgi:F0F1-type ATP synthase membrane subunit c/vacuolar-type H+-ATPase subunit K
MEGVGVEMLGAWVVMAVWVGGALVVGVMAAARNRSGFAWCLLSLVLSPVLMGLLVALLPRGDDGLQAVTAATHRHCPECREVVRADARRCKHCGSQIEPITAPPG